MGYPGTARWVALYLSGNHAMYHDGDATGTGETDLFFAFKRHQVIAPHVAGAHLGSADEEASEWLLVDRQHQALYLAEREEARRFLAAQWPCAAALPEETTAERARRLEANHALAELPTWMERLAESVRERRANVRLMQQWLDQHP